MMELTYETVFAAPRFIEHNCACGRHDVIDKKPLRKIIRWVENEGGAHCHVCHELRHTNQLLMGLARDDDGVWVIHFECAPGVDCDE